jgi:hypothetical protein
LEFPVIVLSVPHSRQSIEGVEKIVIVHASISNERTYAFGRYYGMDVMITHREISRYLKIIIIYLSSQAYIRCERDTITGTKWYIIDGSQYEPELKSTNGTFK